MNTITLIGRIANDLELKQTSTGKFKCDFSLAVNRQTINDEKVTDFIKCVVWGKQAENLQLYQKKGSQIALIGKLQIDNYTDKDGNNRSMSYVLVNELFYLDKKENKETTQKEDKAITNWESAKTIEIEPEELPFY